MEQPIDSELADTIAMLEQILEVMPQDLMTLKALYNAFSQGADRKAAFTYLCRLSDAASASSDEDGIAFVVEHMGTFHEEFPDTVAAQLERLGLRDSSIGLGDGEAVTAVPVTASGEGERDVSEELSLAWRLYEDDQFSQDDYSAVLHDLTETASKDLAVPVSVLHVLHDRGYTNINRIMSYCSQKSGVPCIGLAQYEVDEAMVSVLPFDLVVKEGVLPFAFFGKDLLVGVLNPFNRTLIDKAEEVSGLRCHSYLVPSEDYDAKIKWMREVLEKE